MHYVCAVFTTENTLDAVDKLLHPFDARNKSADEKLLDWYELGGRWYGSLILKQGKIGIKGEPSLLEMASQSKTYDMAYVEDIDFAAIEKSTGKKLETYSMLTPYGEWIENDNLNKISDKNFAEMIKRAIKNHWYMAMVDYHM